MTQKEYNKIMDCLAKIEVHAKKNGVNYQILENVLLIGFNVREIYKREIDHVQKTYGKFVATKAEEKKIESKETFKAREDDCFCDLGMAG